MSNTTTVKITLNGKPAEIQSGLKIADLLAQWKIRPELVTVELNESILQKLDYETTSIKQGDVINFVFYMGGGSAPDGFSSIMLRGIDVSAGSLGELAKLALGRARTVANLPYPGALDVNATNVAMPDSKQSIAGDGWRFQLCRDGAVE